MASAVGIDLGSTNSCVSVLVARRRTDLIIYNSPKSL